MPEPISREDNPVQIPCPKCNVPMQGVEVEGTQVDRCPSCEGLWFDALEERDVRAKESVDKLDPPGAQAKAGRNEQKHVNCPRCHSQMIRLLDRHTREVWYESCPICYGKFFDAGEFRAIQPRTLGEVLRSLLGSDPSVRKK
jgi:Zn-finger nucleic acid-binding protein